MKIYQNPYVQYSQTANRKQTDQGSGMDFADALKGAARPDATSVQSSAASDMLQISGVGQVLAATATKTPEAQTDKTLGLLENYSQAMSDPTRSLKQIAPLVDDIEKEAATLDRMQSQLADDDELKQIASQTAILASVEAAKFRRGDYV